MSDGVSISWPELGIDVPRSRSSPPTDFTSLEVVIWLLRSTNWFLVSKVMQVEFIVKRVGLAISKFFTPIRKINSQSSLLSTKFFPRIKFAMIHLQSVFASYNLCNQNKKENGTKRNEHKTADLFSDYCFIKKR